MTPIAKALAGPLAGMTAYPHFLIYEIRPSSRPGKMDKVPVYPVQWGDRDQLLGADQALQVLQSWQGDKPVGIGYALQDDDPFVFLDMDEYTSGGKWLPLVGQFYERLKGAAFEVSSSRKGCHFFGAVSQPLKHANKNISHRLELYSSGRFVALTGLNATGDCLTDCTQALQGIIAEYFVPRAVAMCEWSGEGPRDDWDGPTDDADLIRIACNSTSVKAAFGGGATFRQLWQCEADKLVAVWPPSSEKGDFDRSSADMALATHLAFWTGCDAPRMERLMKASGLLRDKYQRADYMQMTVGKAIANCGEVLGSRKPERIQGAQWTEAPLAPFPERRQPVEVAIDMASGSGYFNKAMSDGRLDKLAWVAVRVYPGECHKAAEMLTTLGVGTEEEIRDCVTQANAELIPVVPVEFSQGEPLSKDPVKIEEAPFHDAYAQSQIFAGCVIIPKLNAVLLPSGEVLGPDAFNALMPAGSYAMSEKKVVDKAWQALVGSQFMRWPRASDIAFRPDLPSLALFEEDERVLVNGFIPHRIRTVQGDASPFLQHLVKLIPDHRDRSILLSWMAAVAQHPGCKFRWAPVLQGCEGNGKGLVTGVLQHVVGRRYTHAAQASDLANKFNGWLVGKLLVIVNEADLGRDREIIDAVKPMITDDDVAVQGKGRDQETARNFANFILTTNHVGAIGQAVKGRRYAVFVTAQQREDELVGQGMDGRYFQRLTTWLRDEQGYEAVAGFLLSYPIEEEFNPATTCLNAPRTSSYAQTLNAAKGSVEQAIEEAIKEGRKGFRPPFVCSFALGELLKELRKGGAVAPNKRRELMQSIGYDWHPSLREGRSSRVISQSGGVRPVIFVKVDHLLWQVKDAAEIIDKFENSLNPFINYQNQVV